MTETNMGDVTVPPATPAIPLTPETRQAYEDLYAKAELAVQATADGTILGSLNDTKDAIGAVISADNEARLKQDDASFKAVEAQIAAANDAMKKLAADIASVASKIKIFGQVAAGINQVLGLVSGL
jgi:fumarate hydratase class II